MSRGILPLCVELELRERVQNHNIPPGAGKGLHNGKAVNIDPELLRRQEYTNTHAHTRQTHTYTHIHTHTHTHAQTNTLTHTHSCTHKHTHRLTSNTTQRLHLYLSLKR